MTSGSVLELVCLTKVTWTLSDHLHSHDGGNTSTFLKRIYCLKPQTKLQMTFKYGTVLVPYEDQLKCHETILIVNSSCVPRNSEESLFSPKFPEFSLKLVKILWISQTPPPPNLNLPSNYWKSCTVKTMCPGIIFPQNLIATRILPEFLCKFHSAGSVDGKMSDYNG